VKIYINIGWLFAKLGQYSSTVSLTNHSKTFN
jgi:hypothetical protein